MAGKERGQPHRVQKRREEAAEIRHMHTVWCRYSTLYTMDPAELRKSKKPRGLPMAISEFVPVRLLPFMLLDVLPAVAVWVAGG